MEDHYVAHVRQELLRGVSPDVLRSALLQTGYEPYFVEQLFQNATKPVEANSRVDSLASRHCF